MTTPVLTVDINDPAGEELRLFADYPVHHLPVLNQQKVVGKRIRLSAQQLVQAMAAVVTQAGTDRDPEFVHRALLYLHARVALLEQIRHIASHFMEAGEDQQLHSALVKALEAISRAEQRGFTELVKRDRALPLPDRENLQFVRHPH
jgi:signal-transduction protein with cAMP-binding, CBS, and nucleotidyltransferase domain